MHPLSILLKKIIKFNVNLLKGSKVTSYDVLNKIIYTKISFISELNNTN